MPFTNLYLEFIYATNTILSLLFFIIVLFYLIDSKDLRTQKNIALLGMFGGITGYYFTYFIYISFYNQEGVDVLNTIVSILTLVSLTTFIAFLFLFVTLEAKFPHHELIKKGIIGIYLFIGFFTALRYLMYDIGTLIHASIYHLFLSDIFVFFFFLFIELLILFTLIVCSFKKLTNIFFPESRLILIRLQYLKFFAFGILLGGISELIKVIGSTSYVIGFTLSPLIIGGITSTIGLIITFLIIVVTRKHIRDIAWNIIEVQLEELKELDVLKDQFIDFTSHEIRTPLSIIWGNVELLQQAEKKGRLTKKQREKIFEAINRNYRRIERLIGASYDLSRLRRGLFELNKKSTNLVEIIENTVKNMKKYVEKSGLMITFVKEGNNLQENVIIDSDRIDQVIRNLIENSVKFSDNGEIVVMLRNTLGEYVVSIKDEGIGIDTDDLDQVFDLFRPRKNTKTKGQGLGVGLYISKSIIESHHGKIWVDSEGEGKGSTFSFSIPKNIGS